MLKTYNRLMVFIQYFDSIKEIIQAPAINIFCMLPAANQGDGAILIVSADCTRRNKYTLQVFFFPVAAIDVSFAGF